MVGVSFLVSDPLCLKLGQRSGDDVPVNLLRRYSLKKGQGPRAQLSPSESGPWLTGGGVPAGVVTPPGSVYPAQHPV